MKSQRKEKLKRYLRVWGCSALKRVMAICTFIILTGMVGKKRVSNIECWSDEKILAATLQTECSICSDDEAWALATVINNRVRDNHNNYGKSYFLQVFHPRQFSGVIKFYSDDFVCINNNALKWGYYVKPHKSGKRNNPEVSENFISTDRMFKIAQKVLDGQYSPLVKKNQYYFLNIDLYKDYSFKDTNEVKKIKKINNFYHIIF